MVISDACVTAKGDIDNIDELKTWVLASSVVVFGIQKPGDLLHTNTT